MEQVAILGARGMLGRAAREAVAAAYPSAEGVALDLPELDLADRDAVLAHPALREADVLLNCAAYTDVERCEEEEALATRVNGDGPAHLAALAAETGALLVHVSTDFVFGGDRDTPYPPEAPRAPLSAYGRSKLAGERALEASEARWCLVRTAWLFGPGGKHFVDTMLRLARRHGRLAVVRDQVGSPTYAPHLARALLGLASRGAEGTYHWTNAGRCSWHAFACEIVRQAGLDVPVEPITAAEARSRFGLRAERPAYSVLDCAAADAVLGEARPRWEDALAAYLHRPDREEHADGRGPAGCATEEEPSS